MTLYNYLCCYHNHEVLFPFHQDIMISGAPNPAETTNAVKRTNENHLANQLRYSLRVSITRLIIYLRYSWKIAELAFCRCMLLSYICSCPGTSRSYLRDKKFSATALRLTSYIVKLFLIHPKNSLEKRRFVLKYTIIFQSFTSFTY